MTNRKVKKQNNNTLIYIAVAVCAASVIFMLIAVFIVPRDNVRGDFVPPQFAANAENGVPTVPKELGWYTPQADGLGFKISVCGELKVKDGKADIYFTNYADNDVWLMLRVLSADGTVLAESGIVKPGEYVQSIELEGSLKNGQKLYYKVMAYEPETYYSAGAFTLETYAQIGG